MMDEKKLFTNLDESREVSVRLGNDKEIEVCGVGTITINTRSGELKQLHGVQYVSGLAHNLLSIRQLLTRGYSVMFREDKCVTSNDRTKEKIVVIPRMGNNMFPLDLTRIKRLNLAVKNQNVSEMWHKSFGHLTYKSLESLAHKKLVYSLPDLKKGSLCEDCTVCKQARSSFPLGKFKRTTAQL